MPRRRGQIVRNLCAVGLTVSLFAGSPALGAAPRPAEPPPAPEAPPDPALARAETLYRNGVVKYETAKYDEAVELWTEAYSLIEATPENRAIRNDLVYNISRAQVAAYKVDQDVKRLRQAKQLLERYIEVYRELAGESAEIEAELAQVRERVGEIDAMIEADERERGPDPARTTTDDAGARRQARALVISGAVVTSLGIAGFGVMLGGIGLGVRADKDFEEDPAQRDLHRRRGRQANVLVATGAAVGAALLAAGIALLVIGRRAERRLKPTASFGPDGFSVGLTARF